MSLPHEQDDDLPFFDESIYKEEDHPELMYICCTCNKLLDPAFEQWICTACMHYDSIAYKHNENHPD